MSSPADVWVGNRLITDDALRFSVLGSLGILRLARHKIAQELRKEIDVPPVWVATREGGNTLILWGLASWNHTEAVRRAWNLRVNSRARRMDVR